MSMDKTVLSFHESLLKQSDVDLLHGPYWLNDTIISFYFEYLEKVKYKESKNLSFVSPEVTQCLKLLNDDLGAFLDPLEIKQKDFVFFALNDNDSAYSVGGSHWSLLVYSRIENNFFHLDSLIDHNHEQAQLLQCNLANYFECEGECSLTSIKTLQQRNGYDCGIHVLCNVDMIVNHILMNQTILPNCPIVHVASVTDKRDELLSLIDSLKN